MLDLNAFDALTFDCYGTLIDWETGILSALKPIFNKYDRAASDADLLKAYSDVEPQIQARHYQKYADVLAQVLREIAQRFDFVPEEVDCIAFSESLKSWQPFPDTVEALKTLKGRYRLGIISNIDNDLFDATSKHLGIAFDWIITAEQVKSYKPALNNFEAALKRIDLPKERILHVAESLYHDIVPARSLGFKTVWVNRRRNKSGPGASRSVEARPDLEIPDLVTLARMIQPR